MKNKFKLLHCQIATLSKKYDCPDIILLLAQAIKKNKEFIFAHPEHKLLIRQYCKLRYYIYLRQHNYPLAYITHHKEFYNLNFYINRNVLVPRPETEIMVDEILKMNSTSQHSTRYRDGFFGQSVGSADLLSKNSLLIDVGTGSGCIPISILKNLTRPIKAWAIDISLPALRVAKKNADQNKVDVKFVQGDLLKPVINNHQLKNFDHLIITANLPYLTDKQFNQEISIQKEPKIALVSDEINGLKLYRQLLQQINYIITHYELTIDCFLEIDPSQSKRIKQLISESLPIDRVRIKKDLAGLARLAYFTIKKTVQ